MQLTVNSLAVSVAQWYSKRILVALKTSVPSSSNWIGKLKWF